MYVCASTECYPGVPYPEVFDTLAGLEFTAVEIAIHAEGTSLKPAEVLANPNRALDIIRGTHRLALGPFSLEFDVEGDAYYRQFEACCRLAKAAKVVVLTVPAAELGTPFNEEVERLRELVRIATLEGVLVSMKTTVGCMTQDPATAVVLCDQAKGLGLTLDPSHYTFGPHQGKSYDNVLPYVYHVQLRDSTKDNPQVRVGQGEIEYNKLIAQLEAENYTRGFSVLLPPQEGIDHNGELRKLRLLLDSSL